jgi:hypothetical protein
VHFIDPSEGILSSKDVEVKCGIHPAGTNAHWTADDQRTTLLFLDG